MMKEEERRNERVGSTQTCIKTANNHSQLRVQVKTEERMTGNREGINENRGETVGGRAMD